MSTGKLSKAAGLLLKRHKDGKFNDKEIVMRVEMIGFCLIIVSFCMEEKTMELKQELAAKAENTGAEKKLTKSMRIEDLIKAMGPEIKKALPEVITPERFIRMSLNALNTTPKLKECTQMSFLAALMQAAQLGLEPNTPLGQAYLIPYKNKGVMEVQFQIGYKGLIDLCYRSEQMQVIQAQAVYENDAFDYELGLNPKLIHRPALSERGEIRLFYGVFKLINGGYGFEVMSKGDMDRYAQEYSKSVESSSSPWRTNYIAMGKKTVIKQVLKYAPLKADISRALSADETIKRTLSANMSELHNETVYDTEFEESV